MVDETGADCARGQGLDICFVAGTFGAEAMRECSIPANRTIVGPVLNQFSTDPTACDAFEESVSGEVTLDGNQVAIEPLTDDNIAITGVAGNPVTREAGELVSAACGLWFTIPPLDPGPHDLTISGTSGEFGVRVMYHLNVIA